nr:PREDICTED: lachesin-like isoform X1 [Bemisia tabaci]XP_018902167.1 PREDICTED: lachesin-like isoform X1 [Bemisia tabaci]XP_018902168.1 PREDICTED: lachesin-like isoform X1 [Bemisia tabaci]
MPRGGSRGCGAPKSSRYFFVSILHALTIICQAITDAPSFAEPVANVTVALGRNASLQCVVNNLGRYKVAWIHIDRQMIVSIHYHVIARVARYNVSHDSQKTWLLHVAAVQEEDRGYYMCQVNTNPMISQVGYLQVVVPPNILDDQTTQSSVAVRENSNITLTCRAEGFPSPTIKWRREDGQGISVDKRTKVKEYIGEHLNISKVYRSEMGAYLCIATNGVPPTISKRIIVDVEFPPMIWVPNQLVGAPAGTDVTLDCHAEAYPKAISYWTFEKGMILHTKKHVVETIENSYRSQMKLTINSLTSKDFGTYKCVSKNSLGDTEGSIRLYEIPLPSSMSPKATEIVSGVRKEDNSLTRAVTRSFHKIEATKPTSPTVPTAGYPKKYSPKSSSPTGPNDIIPNAVSGCSRLECYSTLGLSFYFLSLIIQNMSLH